MAVCCCSLAGTKTCIGCHNNPNYEQVIKYYSPVYIAPIGPNGWICPRCGRVNAPSITQCNCKEEE